MRTLIVDDEPIARRLLREELELQANIEVVGEADNGETAVKMVRELKPDLMLLDLEMPALGGFGVIQRLSGNALPAIVIVTAYNQHAIQAFEAGAVDYLLKPVTERRLTLALERARSLVGKPKENAEHIERIANLESGSSKSNKVVGRIGEEFFLLNAADVLAFQAEGELVWIVTARQKYIASHPLRAIEQRIRHLPFQRVHRNAIVNVNHVRKMSVLSSQRWLLTLSNTTELIVSKRQAHAVKHILHW